jgi:hypothetical protein
MTTKYTRVVAICVVAFGFVFVAPLKGPSGNRPAAPAVVGSVRVSANTTIDGYFPLPDETLFSGDRVRVTDGAATVSLKQGKGSQITFWPQTSASFSREADELQVRLEEGNANVMFFHSSDDALLLRIMSGNVSISAAKGLATGGTVLVTNEGLTAITWRGVLRVEGDGKTMDLAEGREIRFTADTAGSPQAADKPSGQASGVKSALAKVPQWAVAVGVAAGAGVAAGVIASRAKGRRTIPDCGVPERAYASACWDSISASPHKPIPPGEPQLCTEIGVVLYLLTSTCSDPGGPSFTLTQQQGVLG